MASRNGELVSDAEKDLAKIFCFYRHEPKEGLTGTKGFGFIRGVGLKPDCAYASTVSHDCHNLLVIGTGDAAMCTAVNALIDSDGGIVVVIENQVAAIIPLPLAGLMTLEDAETASEQLDRVEKALKDAGCPYDGFEMTLNTAALIVLEQLHITNRGLVELKDGKPACPVSLIVEGE